MSIRQLGFAQSTHLSSRHCHSAPAQDPPLKNCSRLGRPPLPFQRFYVERQRSGLPHPQAINSEQMTLGRRRLEPPEQLSRFSALPAETRTSLLRLLRFAVLNPAANSIGLTKTERTSSPSSSPLILQDFEVELAGPYDWAITKLGHGSSSREQAAKNGTDAFPPS